ncbi:MAG: sodium-dependent transporter [Myxococcales bacterium]|nr:sodium-dependent transporter [Myxococcales bacterium]USN51427.1 MAG: sodium-dependent transporter [Myxococcales bacterium]
MEDIRREHWRSRLGIIFATSGSAIGLGTLWKLPYLVGQGGGGAFIAMFLVFTLLLGTPLFVAELVLGKHFQKSITGIFNNLSSSLGSYFILGWFAIIATFLIAGWYGVVSGWGINYLLMALTDAFKGRSPAQLSMVFSQFRAAGSIGILWQGIFVALTCLVLAKGIKDGVERFSKLFFSLLFLLVVGLFLYASTLSGFGQALDYIIAPDFSKVDRTSVLAALGLSLFTLSLGQGIMVTYGSYLPKKVNIFKTAFIVSFSVVAISILISLMIFPMIFSFGFPPEAGESLLFVTMPFVTEQLPGSMALSTLFFLLLIFAALTSYIGQLEVLVSSFIESFKISRQKAVFISGVGCFIVGIPVALMTSEYNPYPNFQNIFHSSLLDTLYVLIDWLLIMFSFGICCVVGYKLKKDDLAKALNIDINHFGFVLWRFLIRFLVPLCLLIVTLSRIGCLY